MTHYFRNPSSRVRPEPALLKKVEGILLEYEPDRKIFEYYGYINGVRKHAPEIKVILDLKNVQNDDHIKELLEDKMLLIKVDYFLIKADQKIVSFSV